MNSHTSGMECIIFHGQPVSARTLSSSESIYVYIIIYHCVISLQLKARVYYNLVRDPRHWWPMRSNGLALMSMHICLFTCSASSKSTFCNGLICFLTQAYTGEPVTSLIFSWIFMWCILGKKNEWKCHQAKRSYLILILLCFRIPFQWYLLFLDLLSFNDFGHCQNNVLGALCL